jgi:hypothetical protein
MTIDEANDSLSLLLLICEELGATGGTV